MLAKPDVALTDEMEEGDEERQEREKEADGTRTRKLAGGDRSRHGCLRGKAETDAKREETRTAHTDPLSTSLLHRPGPLVTTYTRL